MTQEESTAIMDLKSENYSVREIAEKLDIPKTTVHNIIKSNGEQPKQEQKQDLSGLAKEVLALSDERKEKRFVARINRHINEVLDCCVDCTWTSEEVDELLEKAQDLKDKIEDYADENSYHLPTLKIIESVDCLIEYLEEKAEEAEDEDIVFNEDKKTRFFLNSLLVDSFTDEAQEEAQEDEDEDEDK